jgi:hypothetical protein
MSTTPHSAPGAAITREDLLARARELASVHGEALSQIALCQAAGITRKQLIRLFGSWGQLRQELGLTPDGLHSRQTLPDEAIRDKLRAVVAEHGENVSISRFSELTGYSVSLVVRRFGSWSALRKSIGISKRSQVPKQYSDQEIFDDIFQVVCRIHRKPTHNSYMRDGGTISPQTMCARFGSWEKVIYAYEDEMDRRRKYPEPRYRQDPRNEKAFYVFLCGKPLYHIEYDTWEFTTGKKTPLPPDFEL